MRSSNAFRDFVIDQLSDLGGIRARAMFGGIGLYAGEVFFGLIASDVLYLKVDESNLARYREASSHAFKPYADKPMTMPYYDVPVSVLEHAETLVDWAKASIAVAKGSKTRTKAKAKRR